MTEINIKNGGGWNDYRALRNMKALKAGTRGLAARQGIAQIDVSPSDEERPLGIAVRFLKADGDLFYSLFFDQNDSAGWIRETVHALLVEGVQNRIDARSRALAREFAVKKITAWRRNFDAAAATKDTSGSALRAKLGVLRDKFGKYSRKECWKLTRAIRGGRVSYREVVAEFRKVGPAEKLWERGL